MSLGEWRGGASEKSWVSPFLPSFRQNAAREALNEGSGSIFVNHPLLRMCFKS